MLAIQKTQRGENVSVNALPCKLHYNGPVDAATRFKPQENSEGVPTAYFRGRKLLGRKVQLPEGYEGWFGRHLDFCVFTNAHLGHVLKKTDRKHPKEEPESSLQQEDANMSEDGSEDDRPDEIGVVESVASFDGVTVWGHGSAPATEDEPYARGVEEWIAFAQAVSRSPTHDLKSKSDC